MSLFLIVGLLPFAYLRDRSIFSIKKHPLSLWVYIYIALYWGELIISFILGIESFYNSLKVIRVSFIILAYFIIITIPIDVIKRFLKVALLITIIQGFLYLLQFVGINILASGGEYEYEFGVAGSTPKNTPPLCALFIFLLWRFGYLKSKSYLLFSFFFFLLFLTFIRGRIISILIGLAYYAFINSERRRRIPIIIAFLIIIPIASRVIDMKSNYSNSGNGLEEIGYVLKQSGDFSQIDISNGTFSFRMAMLTERIVWLLDNPRYLLTGVGTMHEDSPKTLQMFDFRIGTRNEDRYYGHTIIESGDITWVPIVLRYGLLGVFVHIMLFLILFINTRNRKDTLVMLAAFTICLFVGTFDGAYFEIPLNVYILSFLYAVVSRSNYENRLLLI